MELIFAAALCSVVVSVLIKICSTRGFSIIQMITWNYASASVLCYLWFKPDLIHVSVKQTPWWLIISLGILLPTIFLCLSKALQTAGILKTEIAQRLSVVLSLCAAWLIFNEQFSPLKIIGIVLGFLAVVCILYAQKGDGAASRNKWGILYLILVWAGYALIDVLLKYTTGLGLQFSVVLNLMFVCAFFITLMHAFFVQKTWPSVKNISAGLLLGVLNIANIALYVKAHMLLKDSPAVVFAGMNILVVLLGVLSGMLLFKEKIKPATVAGLIMGIAGVMCLASAMAG